MTSTPAVSPEPAPPAPTDQTSSVPPPEDSAAHTRAFFDALLATAPDDLTGLLWTLQDKKSTWVPFAPYDGADADADPAGILSRHARRLADKGNDVYVAVSAAATAGLHDTRISSANAAGIFGLWADIDVADPDVHKKWNLPPTIDAALELLDAAQLEPTMVIHSGHGLQAWWLFKDFWAFDSEDERLQAAGLAQRWNTTLQARAAERSWVVDSTFDLARVMRVPGTLNRKGLPVMPVRLIRAGGPSYEHETIDQFCVDESYLASKGVSPTKTYVPDDFEVSDANKVDFERLQALLDNDDVFRATYDNNRRDFTDKSPSSFDLSLAGQAARAGWSDMEIAALILAFRRRHNLDPAKALRKDYIGRTLSKARDGLARDDASEVLDEVGDALDRAKQSGDDEKIKDARRAALDVIGQQLGMEVLHFIKYLSEPPQFAVVTPTVTIPLGGADGILVWAKFKQAVWQSVGHQVDRFKAADWDQITHLVPRAWEEQDVGAEATERGEVAAWLSSYLSARPPVDSLDEAAASEYPYNDADGRVIMFGPGFRRWLYLTYQERVSNIVLGRRLRAFGCEPDKVNVVDSTTGSRTTKSVWRLPASVRTSS